jgi:hypothetical protein
MALPEWANKLITIAILIGLLFIAFNWFIGPVSADIARQMARPVMPDEIDLRPYSPYVEPVLAFLVIFIGALGSLYVWTGKIKIFT